ncbi:acetylcholine receptor subunit alpha-like 1 [Lepeophtheirus salmonis]|uniref:acetylcholine receptor subunit alpha-like 1 n=1 Tax=Lepeophtheirus salmonis TaxID=72036 RepID=UPI001AE8318B|nr:acetylcholine receptor subunit alpha-like 1 [Lepeophtheirus salmonis]
MDTWTHSLCVLFFIGTAYFSSVCANPDAKRLYDDLLSNYDRLIRPVGNSSDRLTVKMGLKLSQIIGIDMKRQIMITNVWVAQEWHDYKLKWKPEDYGGVKHLHVPSQNIWLPDIVLYNNADGNYEVTIMTKAVLHFSGRVVWNPPAIYKSSCEIDVEFFPFDEQKCFMKFGSWTYDGYMVDLRHINQKGSSSEIEIGMDLQEYYISTEWDVMTAPAVRNEKYYPCCEEPYPDIIFYLTLRRKSLFYTVNVIIPCVGISFLSVLVFYLPSDSGEKVSLSISILLSLTVFFLLLAEIIPSTSIAVPLLGKYLLFTMILVTFSVMLTIGVLNVNFRTPATHKMAPWVRKTFVEFLPRFLFIRRPEKEEEEEEEVLFTPETECDEKSQALLQSSQPPMFLQKEDLLKIPPPFSLDHDEKSLQRISPSRDDIQSKISPSSGDPFYGSGNSGFPLYPLPLGGIDSSKDSVSELVPTFYGGSESMGYHGDYSSCERHLDKAHELNPALEKAMNALKFVAQHVKNEDNFESFSDDWKYVAMVLDRILLWVFTVACVFGTAGIIMAAPSHQDTRQPIDIQFSKVDKISALRMMPESLKSQR